MGVLAICPRTIAQIERVIRPTFISLATYGRCFRLAVAAAQRVAAKRERTAPSEVNRVALAIMAPSVFTYVGDHVAVFAGGQRCALRPGTARPADTHVLVTTS